MDFGLSEDQEILQQSARDFLARECTPALVRQVVEDTSGYPERLYRKLVEMGWTGLLVPEVYGGLGLGTLDLVVLLAEAGRAVLPGPYLASAVLATSAIVTAGSAAQKKRWLPALARGDATGTLAWLEETDRLDPEGIQLRARRIGRKYVLDGTKLFVPYAEKADVLIVPARMTAGRSAEGVTLFLVERDGPGVSFEGLRTIDATRKLYELKLRKVEVPDEAVLGRPGRGWPVLERLLDLAALSLAADSFGGSERLLEMTVEYAKHREQFGRSIASFQAIKHLAAEMVAKIEPSRSLVWYAGYAYEERPRAASRAASMAKARLSAVYSWTANVAVQIHGGIGFTWEHDVHFWFKRAKANELAFGDPAFHRERVARLGRY